MIYLCSGKNHEGYLHALIQSFKLGEGPSKGSLSKFRRKISFEFFKDQFVALSDSFKRPKWRGYHVYGTDGFEMTLPGCGDLREQGYRGRRLKTDSGAKGETYYPHMYTVQTYDVLSRTTKAIHVSIDNHETKGAIENIKSLEMKSITLYDRGFSNNKVMRAHFQARSHFFIKFKSGDRIPVELQEFWKSTKTRDSFLLDGDPDQRVYLFKLKNRKTKDNYVYATSFKSITSEEAESLYKLRWEVENSFRDQVSTLPLEQWHSKTENGVLQELYVRLWIINYARIQQFLNEEQDKNPLSRIYKRSNFKLILDFVISHWREFFEGKRKFLQKIKLLIQISAEKRKRYSRSRKRQLRYQNKNYPAANIIFDHEVKMHTYALDASCGSDLI